MKLLKTAVSIVVIMTMALGLVACDSISQKSNKDTSKITEEDVADLTKDFTKALLDMNTKKLSRLSTKIKDSTIEDIEYIASEYAYDAQMILDTVSFDIDEDDVEIDDDEASIKISYSYKNGSCFVVESASIVESDSKSDSSDEGIENAELSFTFDIEDGDCLVSNADKVCEKFYSEIFDENRVFEVMNQSPVTTVVPYDYDDDTPFFVFALEDEVNSPEKILFMIECYNCPSLDGETLLIEVEEDGNVVYTNSEHKFMSESTITLSYTPEDLGLDEFREAEYCVDVSFKDVDNEYSDYDYVLVNGAPLEEKCHGYMSGNTYYNEYFGFSFEVDKDLIQYTGTDYDFYRDFVCDADVMFNDEKALEFINNGGYITDDDAEGFTLAIVAMRFDYLESASAKDYFENLGDEDYMELTKINELECVKISNNPVNQSGVVFVKDSNVLMIFMNGSSEGMKSYSSIVDNIVPLS